MNARALLLTCLFTFAPLASAPVQAAPAGWPESFPPAQVGSYLGPRPLRLLVTGSGGRDAEAAASALREALLRSGKATRVEDATALGDATAQNDQTIVQTAQNFQIDRIVVVRVFPGSAGAPDRAAVRIYDKAGRAVATLTTGRGVPVSAWTADGAPISTGPIGTIGTLPAPGPLQPDTDATRSDAQRAWERSVLWYADWDGIDRYGAVVNFRNQPLRGTQRENLSREDLYLALGRPDLIRSESRRRAVRLTLGFTSIALGLAGTGTLIWSLVSLGNVPAASGTQGGVTFQYASNDSTYTLSRATPWIVTGSLLGGCFLAALASTLIPPHALGAEAERRLVEEHDRRLRQRLGLPDLPRVARRPLPRRITGFALAPAIGPGGAGLGASFGF